MPMPIKDPRSEAVGRTIQEQTPATEASGQVGAGQTGEGQQPVATAVKIFELVVSRLAQMNPAAGEKLGVALNQLKSTIEEVKSEVSAQGEQPAGQPGMMRGTPMEGQNRGTSLQGTGVSPR